MIYCCGFVVLVYCCGLLLWCVVVVCWFYVVVYCCAGMSTYLFNGPFLDRGFIFEDRGFIFEDRGFLIKKGIYVCIFEVCV